MTNNTKLSVRKVFCLYGGFVLLPLSIAVLIYCIFRVNPPPLLKLVWYLPALKLDSRFDWLVYNAPDALWAFGFTSFLLIACRGDSPKVRTLYLTLGFVLMIGLEVGQGRWFAGTYDPLDVVATAAGAGLAWLFLKRLVK
jgi:hypothetical protein